MKIPTIVFCIAAILLSLGCKSPAQQQAGKTVDAIQQTIKTFGPPEVATLENGYIMKAVIDGKLWKAKKMKEISRSNTNFIHGTGNGAQIGFYIDRDHITVGKSHELNESHSADLDLGGDDLLSARQGAYVITYAGEHKIEGTFHFKAVSHLSDKKSEVTHGFFRIMLQ